MVDRTTGLSRRQLLRTSAGALGAAAVGAPMLTGCSPGGVPAGRRRLDFWHLLSGGDGIKMASLIDTVNAASDSYYAWPTVLAWGTPYYTKLAMAAAGGRAPDVAVMHASRIPGFAPGGLLDPWDLDMLAEVGVTEDKFPGPIWQAGHYGDELFAVALDAHPFIMMFNPEICDKAGVLDSDGSLMDVGSTDEFLDMAREIAGATDGGHGLSYGYLGDGAQMWRLWYALYRQQNAEMVLTGTSAEYDLDAAVKGLEFMQNLLDDEIASSSSDYANAVAEFASGKSGLFFTGVWELPTMQNAGIPLDAQTIPTVFSTPAAYGDSHTFVLPHQDNPDPEARRNVYQFVSDILHNSFSWAEAGHIPAFLPITESQEYQDLVPQAHYANAADILNYDPSAWFSGSGSNFQGYFAEYIQGVLLEGQDPAAGFESFMGRVDTLMSMPNPVAN